MIKRYKVGVRSDGDWDYDVFSLECDKCRAQVSDFNSFSEARSFAKSTGWKTAHGNKGWMNICPSCAGRKGQQDTASKEEAEQRKSELRTQGRKGCKAVRINMAFTPENHEYIKVVARASGVTMTELTNSIVSKFRRNHSAELERAKAFRETVDGKQMLHDMKQDLCYHCGKYRNAHEGACDGCRWRDM